jgi:ABC-type amino acid transport substrate-binding protein
MVDTVKTDRSRVAMGRRDRRVVWLSLASLLALVVWLPAPGACAALAGVKARGKLVVLAYPDTDSPFLARTGAGQFEGVDASILRGFATSLGVQLEVREITRYDDLLPALVRGDGDVVAGGLSITPAREEVVDFSVPYFPVAIMVIARRDAGVRSVDGLRGKRGAAVPGTTHDSLMREMGVPPTHQLLRSGLAYEALQANHADFAFVDSTSGVVSLERFPDLVLVGMLPNADYYGFALSPGSDLRAELDRHLALIRRQGRLYSLFERHLGSKAVELYELFRKSTHNAPSRLP